MTDRPMTGRPAAGRKRRGHAFRVLGVVVLATLLLASVTSCARSSSIEGSKPPTTSSPAYKITVAGDSISVGLGASLRTAAVPGTVVKVIGEEGTGLARPDGFDWPTRLTQLAHDFPPQVLVFSLSSNDAQDLTDAKGAVVVPFTNTKAWAAEYSRRLAASFDAFKNTKTTVVWVGHVRTTDDRVGLTNRLIQNLAAATAADRGWVVVADLAELLGSGNEPATACLMKDGLHLSVACLDNAAIALQPQLPKR